MVKTRNPAKVGAIAFTVATIGVFFANNLVSGFDISLKTIIFLVGMGFALFLAFTLAGEAKQVKEISFTDVIVYVGLLVGLGAVFVYLDLFPEFSVVGLNVLTTFNSIISFAGVSIPLP